MAKRPQEDPPAGAPMWMATFSDLMNLLLCFFVLLFSMSTVDAQKYEEVVASFSNTFSVFQNGASSIGDGMLISNGVSQLNELDVYINSTGKAEDVEEESNDILAKVEEEKILESEQLAEQIDESVKEMDLEKEIDIDFTSQYVLLTFKGAFLFDSGKATLKPESLITLGKVGQILETYSKSLIEIEGHTDNVPIHNATFKDNNELSSSRALAVFEFMNNNTLLDPSMMKHSGRGEYVPVADNSTLEGRAKNRRVEIKIYNSLSSY
ncbi:MAG TPA: flagellar motor protein MotB [Lachnospiraceae bacterium]|nr:flagellar motor protein MotB [Lachnospiraceae bacterium]